MPEIGFDGAETGLSDRNIAETDLSGFDIVVDCVLGTLRNVDIGIRL